MPTQVEIKLNRDREWAMFYASSVLSEVDRALAKEHEGTYELCDACGGKIDWATQQACPQTTLCFKCQSMLSVAMMTT